MTHQRVKGAQVARCGATDGGLTFFGHRVTCPACIALRPRAQEAK